MTMPETQLATAPTGTMPDPSQQAPTQPPAGEVTPPTDQQEPDYKALYEKEKADRSAESKGRAKTEDRDNALFTTQQDVSELKTTLKAQQDVVASLLTVIGNEGDPRVVQVQQDMATITANSEQQSRSQRMYAVIWNGVQKQAADAGIDLNADADLQDWRDAWIKEARADEGVDIGAIQTLAMEFNQRVFGKQMAKKDAEIAQIHIDANDTLQEKLEAAGVADVDTAVTGSGGGGGTRSVTDLTSPAAVAKINKTRSLKDLAAQKTELLESLKREGTPVLAQQPAQAAPLPTG
jgi:hypothetical protein